jgi:hypothetical protein
MATSLEVLKMLIPEGGYSQVGEEFEGITFNECEPITKEQFEAGFAAYDKWEKQRNLQLQKTKDEILSRLGITDEEAKLLLS